jgi:hypothetical protein
MIVVNNLGRDRMDGVYLRDFKIVTARCGQHC